MGSTYLSLTNKVLRRLNEVELTSSNFATATGFHATAKDAVLDAIEEIQQAEIEWPFNHSTDTLTLLTDGTTEYSLAADAQSVDWESFHLVEGVPSSAIGEKYLPVVPYDEYMKHGTRANNINMTASEAGEPEFISPTQNSKVAIYPGYSDLAYNVTYEYWQFPTAVSAHDDTTTIPTRFDYVIVQRALWDCYMFRDNLESSQISKSRWEEGLSNMRTLLINKTRQVFDTREIQDRNLLTSLRVN